MSKRFRISATVAVSLLIIAGAFTNCAKDLPSEARAGSTGGSSVTPGTIAPASTAQNFKGKVRIGSAKQTADISSMGTDWKDIPGAAVTFTLLFPLTAEMRANGSASTVAGAVYSSSHCGVRFVIDGTAYGNPTWGDVIIGVNACSASTSCHTPWTATREMALEPGAHTIKMQMTGWPGADSACIISSQDYSAARLSIEGF